MIALMPITRGLRGGNYEQIGEPARLPYGAGDGDTGGVRLLGIASAGVIDRLTQDKTIRIAYREDAPPFSSKDKFGEPVGFMVDLCREMAKKLADQLHLPSLGVTYVPVIAADRFEAIRQQRADLLCEPTSATLSRRELVDFSIPTFVDGASLMIRADGRAI